MELFSVLGLTLKRYTKGDKPFVNENYKNSCSNGEKQKWSRPKHTIEANIRATKNAKENVD